MRKNLVMIREELDRVDGEEFYPATTAGYLGVIAHVLVNMKEEEEERMKVNRPSVRIWPALKEIGEDEVDMICPYPLPSIHWLYAHGYVVAEKEAT